ncbi:unnamed protein product [Notodromas monacha]|uniref:Hexosyltransferase n=1 Tax=Notodromas monacha TaxID=399045 RepID=A0A7R9GJH6_9CRUS|nr:unnamed protein product [Notodromas monacha]CAG0922839.1 unnamed protein product [Notodromas monacha]
MGVSKYIRKNDAAVIGSKTPRDAVDRKPGRKYSTTWNEYNEISYPYALRGMAYLVTKTHAVVVLAATLGAHPLNWDDRYITGIWAMKLGSRQIFWNSLLMDYKLRGCRPLQEWVDGNSTSMSTPAILCAKGPLYKPAFQKMLLMWNQTEVTVV